jgi:hypothetical protein
VNDTAPDFVLPATPPPEALAELDAAARALEGLAARGARLSVRLDDPAGTLRVELDEGEGARALTPTELFGLLA